MFAIRSYFVVIMSVMGTIFAFRPIGIEEEQNFFENILKEHNEYRKIHDSPVLYFSPYISLMRGRYLNKYSFNLNGPQNYGVNKFSMDLCHDSILNAELAKKLVGSWYETGKNYNYLDNPTNNHADKFTQIVWRNTKELSLMMGVENDVLYVIATYFPKGNIVGEYTMNVKKPQDLAYTELRIDVLKG